MRLLAISFALAAVLVAVPAAAVDRLVDDGLVPCLSGKLPLHGTISAAVAAAAPGETILVCAGKYSDNVVVPKADLTLKGQGLVRVVAATSAVGAPGSGCAAETPITISAEAPLVPAELPLRTRA